MPDVADPVITTASATSPPSTGIASTGATFKELSSVEKVTIELTADRDRLLGVIKEQTGVRDKASAAIKSARAELEGVERMLRAGEGPRRRKPREPKPKP